MDLMRMNDFPQQFVNIFMIQLKAVARQQTFRNMDWLRNDKIGMEFVLRCFRLFQIRNEHMLRSTILKMFELHLENTSPILHATISRMRDNALERTKEDYTEMEEALRQGCDQVDNIPPSGLRMLLLGLLDTRRHYQARLRTIRCEDMLCGVAKALEVNRDPMELLQMETPSQGSSVAIVFPGDLVPIAVEEHFVTFLRGTIGMLRWKKRCNLYSMTI